MGVVICIDEDTKIRENSVQTGINSTKEREGIGTRDRGGKYYED